MFWITDSIPCYSINLRKWLCMHLWPWGSGTDIGSEQNLLTMKAQSAPNIWKLVESGLSMAFVRTSPLLIYFLDFLYCLSTILWSEEHILCFHLQPISPSLQTAPGVFKKIQPCTGTRVWLYKKCWRPSGLLVGWVERYPKCKGKLTSLTGVQLRGLSTLHLYYVRSLLSWLLRWLFLVVSQRTNLPMRNQCPIYYNQPKMVLYGQIKLLTLSTVLPTQTSVSTHGLLWFRQILLSPPRDTITSDRHIYPLYSLVLNGTFMPNISRTHDNLVL